MKQIILFFTLFSFAIFHSFASDSIDISVNTQDLNIGESVRLQISVEDSGNASGKQDIRIPGIENFSIFSQSEGYNFKSINGNTSAVRQFTLDLRPLKSGSFTLGPIELVSASGGITDDESIEIQVHDLISQSSPKGEKEKDNQTTDSKKKDDGEKNIDSSREDGLMGLRKPELSFVGIIFFLLGFISLFYVLIALFLRENNSPKKEVKKEKTVPIPEDYKKEYISFFKKLSGENEFLSEQEFFRKFNSALRGLLSKEGYSFAPKATLKELKEISGIQKHSVFQILESNYYSEFHTETTDADEREQSIKKVISYLKK